MEECEQIKAELAEIKSDVSDIKNTIYGIGNDNPDNSMLSRLSKIESHLNRIGWAIWSSVGIVGTYVITQIMEKVFK